MADISKIKLPSGSEYNLKDAWARSQISALGSPMHFIGVANTQITDGSKVDPQISNYNFSNVATGDVITYGGKEFVWDGEKWAEFGDLGALGQLAYANTASVTYQPTGTVNVNITEITGEIDVTAAKPTGEVSQPNFTGSNKNVTGSADVEGTVTSIFKNGSINGSVSYKPTGSISKIDFQGAQSTFEGTATISGNVAASFSGAAMESTGEVIAEGTISAVKADGTVTINPTEDTFVKTVSAPTVTSSFTGESANIDATTTATTFSATVDEEMLTLTAETGAVTGTVTAKGKVDSEASVPEVGTSKAMTAATAQFDGKSVTPTFSGTPVDVTVTGTTTGSVSASLNETTATVNVSGIPQGTVTQPTFTGGNDTIVITGTASGTVESTLTEATASIDLPYTPIGNVSKPTFTGNDLTVTAEFTDGTGTATATFVGDSKKITVSSDPVQ